MRQAVVARSFCAGRSHGIASRRFLPGSRNAPLASLPQRLVLGSRKTPLASLSQRLLLGSRKTPCRAHAMRLAELPVKLCLSPTPFPLPSKTWQSPSARLWKETGIRPGNRSNRSENRSVPSRNRSNRTKNPAFGLENRSRLSQRNGRTRIGGHPRLNRKTSRIRIGRLAAPDRENADVANLQASIQFPHMHPRRRWTTV